MPPPETSATSGRFTQENRFLSVTTPLGPDKLLLRSFFGHEGISQLFYFELDLLSEDHQVDFDGIVGQDVTFGVKLADQRKQRFFNGVVARFTQLPGEAHLAHYRAEVVPRLWFLTRTADCRIYQRRTTPTTLDIISEVLHSFSVPFRSELERACKMRDYCVQYRETALNFIMRLMEEEGIVFFFNHEEGRHTLVLADSASAYKPCSEQSAVPYQHAVASRVIAGGGENEEDVILSWMLEKELRSGRCSLADYNFEMPPASFRLFADVETRYRMAGNTRYEIYDYPGGYQYRADGDRAVKLRMEEEETPHIVMQGQGTCRTFGSGFKFTLTKHERRDQNRGYVLTRVDHRAQASGFFSELGGEEAASYENRFTCVPDDFLIRPGRVTPKPLIQGSQTAVVVGPKNEEIHTDQYGRVKVQFHWDRLGQYDDNSSCWIRVTQPWAGKRWGAISLPRVGQEVIVDFLEGDPDRPIITGRVYNAANMPPYELPSQQTKTTFKTYSTTGGGFNEIRFEDKKGYEQVFVHAERNQDIRVRKDVFETVGSNRHLVVGTDQYELVGRDQHLRVKGDRSEKVDGDLSQTVGASAQRKVGLDCVQNIGRDLHIKAGVKVVIDAGVDLTFQAGSSFINIGLAGITIQGPMVYINSLSSGKFPAFVHPCFPHVLLPPIEADTGRPGEKVDLPPPAPPVKPASYGPTAKAFIQATRAGTAFVDIILGAS